MSVGSTNFLALGARRLQDQMERYGGIVVTYRRDSYSFQIEAVPGRNPVEMTDRDGVLLRGQVQDFIVDIVKLQTALRKGGHVDRPIRNDEIQAVFGPHEIIFTVNGEGFSTSHYIPADSYGVAWRIHTKSDRYVSNASGC